MADALNLTDLQISENMAKATILKHQMELNRERSKRYYWANKEQVLGRRKELILRRQKERDKLKYLSDLMTTDLSTVHRHRN
jgi:hypothetical protein